jgi:hypothetical protein
MSTHCRTISILEPENDSIVTANGSIDQSLDESGSVELTIGQTEAEVTFATFKLSSDYDFDDLYIENLVDSPAGAIGIVPIVRTQAGFTVQFDGAPDTANYVLFWRVRVRSGLNNESESSGSTQDPESGQTTLNLAATSQTITFSTARINATYGFSEFRVENLVDSAATQQVTWVQVTSKTQSNFVITINPPPDTVNYKLWWTTR